MVVKQQKDFLQSSNNVNIFGFFVDVEYQQFNIVFRVHDYQVQTTSACHYLYAITDKTIFCYYICQWYESDSS